MGPKKVKKWKPASMGLAKGKIFGVPQEQVMWGVGGTGAALGASLLVNQLFPTAPVDPAILGSIAAGVIGFAILDRTKGYSKQIMPWLVGVTVPLAANIVYKTFFTKPEVVTVPTEQ